MSLQLIWSMFNAHPAKLINVLALLFACPGGWLLHATRRREQRAMASLESHTQRRAPGQPVELLDVASMRMNRLYYCFGFACLALALLVSWVSTRV